eukprot:gene4687-biopygen4626
MQVDLQREVLLAKPRQQLLSSASGEVANPQPFNPTRDAILCISLTQTCSDPLMQHSVYIGQRWYPGTITERSGHMFHVIYGGRDEEDLDVRDTELVITAMQAALARSTRGDYGPKGLGVRHFCEGIGAAWLPATEEVALLYMGALLRGGVSTVGSMQPYCSAINNYPEDLRHEGPAKGRSVVRVLTGMASLQSRGLAEAGKQETEQTGGRQHKRWPLRMRQCSTALGAAAGSACACYGHVSTRRWHFAPSAGAGLLQQDAALSHELSTSVLRRVRKKRQ